MFKTLLVYAALASQSLSKPTIECRDDDDFWHPAEDSCTAYYECYEGKFELKHCLQGTFFDQTYQACRPKSVADCDYTAQRAKAFLAGKRPKIYLGLDDGPNRGTRSALATMNNNGILGTFFINGITLDPSHAGRAQADANRRTLYDVVVGGHDIGDHSYNHMKHNSKAFDSTHVYKDIVADLRYFGRQHSRFVQGELERAGLDAARAIQVAKKMNKLARMPFTNNWRVRKAGSEDVLVYKDCVECTTPIKSGEKSVLLADKMFYGRHQTNIYGWDQEWNFEDILSQDGLTEDKAAKVLLATIGDGTNTKKQGKIVILAHDAQFATSVRGISVNAVFDRFLKLAKEAGYEFRRLSDYPSDESEGYPTDY